MASEVQSDGNFDQVLPADLQDGFSRILEIHYPIGIQAVSRLSPNSYIVLRTASGLVLRFLSTVPPSGESYRVIYTKPWDLSELPPHLEEPLLKFAAAQILRSLAARYAQELRPFEVKEIGAEREYRSERRETSVLLKVASALELEALSALESEGDVASAMGDWDLMYSISNLPLTHFKT